MNSSSEKSVWWCDFLQPSSAAWVQVWGNMCGVGFARVVISQVNTRKLFQAESLQKDRGKGRWGEYKRLVINYFFMMSKLIKKGNKNQ